MTDKRRVVITGLGMVCPVGLDVSSSWDNILAGKSGIGAIEHFDVSDFSTRFGGSVWGFDVSAPAFAALFVPDEAPPGPL